MTQRSKAGEASLDMTQGEPARLLILFAIPMLIGGIFQLLYNLVDTFVVGRFDGVNGAASLAAIGATGSTTMFILSMGQSLTNAVAVVISQAEGARQHDRLRKAVAHAVYLALGAGLVLGLASFFGARPMMELLGTSPMYIDKSVAYIRITCGLCIAGILYNGVASVLRAIGDSRTPLYFLIFSSLLNVALDLIFVLWLRASVAGVAAATVLSQAVSALLCVGYMLRKYPRLRPDAAAWRPDGAILREYLRLGLPMCVQSAVLAVGMFVITAVINANGEETMAAFTIGTKVEQLATVSFSQLAFSFSVYTGQNFGARQFPRIREGVKKGLGIIAGLVAVSTTVMLVFAPSFARLFMNDAPGAALDAAVVLERAAWMIRIEASMFLFLGFIWAVNSALRGIGAVRITLVSSMVELLSKIGLSLLLPVFLGYLGVWLAAPIGWLLGLIPSAAYFLWWSRDPEGRSPSGPEKGEKSVEKSGEMG